MKALRCLVLVLSQLFTSNCRYMPNSCMLLKGPDLVNQILNQRNLIYDLNSLFFIFFSGPLSAILHIMCRNYCFYSLQPSATHSSGSLKTSVNLTWKAPGVGSGKNVTFWYAHVSMFMTYSAVYIISYHATCRYSIVADYATYYVQLKGPDLVNQILNQRNLIYDLNSLFFIFFSGPLSAILHIRSGD